MRAEQVKDEAKCIIPSRFAASLHPWLGFYVRCA